MFDIGWSEMAVAAVIALIVIGPKDLPRVLRVMGQWASKARRIARDFQGSIDDMVRESEIDEIRKEAQSVASIDIKKDIENSIDPTGVLTEGVKPTASEDAGEDETPSAADAPPADSGETSPADAGETTAPSDAAESAPAEGSGSGPEIAGPAGDETSTKSRASG